MSWAFLAGAIVMEVSATLALRASDGLRRLRWAPLVVGGYVVAFALLARALAAGMPVGVAYGTWAAIGIALTAVLARVLFHEPLGAVAAAGIALIAGGVLLVELGSRTA